MKSIKLRELVLLLVHSYVQLVQFGCQAPDLLLERAVGFCARRVRRHILHFQDLVVQVLEL